VYTDAFSFGRAMMQDIMQALPGIDEAMSYSEVMKFVHIFNVLQQTFYVILDHSILYK